MIEGFDREIDVLLRQAARRSFASATDNSKSDSQNLKFEHLDADEISAFAENALPEKVRQSYVRHLADCAECRKNLSALILLNNAAPVREVYAEERQVVAAPLSWYQKIFAFPNSAYALGALVLIFAGVAVFTILQNGGSRNNEVSQSYEKQSGGKGMSPDSGAATVETYSNEAMSSNSAALNSAANVPPSAANSAIAAAPSTAANANAAMKRADENAESRPAPKPAEARRESADSAKSENPAPAAVPPPPKTENEFQIDGEESKRPTAEAQGSINQSQIAELPINGRRTSPLVLKRAEDKAKTLEDSDETAPAKPAATVTVGGKIFKRSANVSYDSAYRGQATVNISRGTKEYKKLDAGLRGIVERIGGTVVIVWKETAYRIR